jgi:hypothetical protein
MIPNFLVVGAGKAGTSWLQICFEEHPEIFVPFQKETNFFSLEYGMGLSWYTNFFKGARHEKAVGEICPSYMVLDRATERIHAINPDMKLLFMLREPVSRAYSHYCMLLRGSAASEDIDKDLNEESRLVQEGRYFHHISRFKEYFPPEQIKVVFYDDLKEVPRDFLKDVYGFLGVDTNHTPSVLNREFHNRKPLLSHTGLYNLGVKVIRAVSRTRTGNRLVTGLRKTGIVNIAYSILPTTKYPELSPEKIKELKEFYREDIIRLSQLSGRDLSHWISVNHTTNISENQNMRKP